MHRKGESQYVGLCSFWKRESRVQAETLPVLFLEARRNSFNTVILPMRYLTKNLTVWRHFWILFSKYLDQKLSHLDPALPRWPIFFSVKTFFDRQRFFFRTKHFSVETCFRRKRFRPKNFSIEQIFDSKFFRPNNFSTEKVFDRKTFHSKNFSTEQFFDRKLFRP